MAQQTELLWLRVDKTSAGQVLVKAKNVGADEVNRF
jgi:hypothetical protein